MNDQSIELVLKNAAISRRRFSSRGHFGFPGENSRCFGRRRRPTKPEGCVLDVSGLTVLPGMFDTHCSLPEPGYTIGKDCFLR
jgi:dihydroorotase-like cyclic amidohydrolase